MKNYICRFSEGRVSLPGSYHERTINTLIDKTGILPPITISRDILGKHNDIDEYTKSQINILKENMKNWQQSPSESVILGDNISSGLLITYNFMRPDNIVIYQKQAVFTPDFENLLIFSVSKTSPFTPADVHLFHETLKSFENHA